MEYAIFVSKIENLEKYAKERKIPGYLLFSDETRIAESKGGKFSRIYFGQEFCERLIPGIKELEKAIIFAEESGLAFTFVTPFVTEAGLESWGNLLEKLHELAPGSEVVFNDLGLFDLSKEKYGGFVNLLGRLLIKQKRGPRILRLMNKAPEEMIGHFRRFNADYPQLARFYKELGFSRYELDNTLQGIERDSEVPASIYFPYLYVTTTRMCLVNQCDSRTESMRAIFPCKQECRRMDFEISHSEIPTPVILAGNTQFIKNENLPQDLEKNLIDRLVYQPEIPI